MNIIVDLKTFLLYSGFSDRIKTKIKYCFFHFFFGANYMEIPHLIEN